MKTLIAAITMVILISGSANAGPSTCGWVLWNNHSTLFKLPPHRLEHWLISEAFETLAECNKAKEEYIAMILEGASTDKKEGRIQSFKRTGDSIRKRMPADDPATVSEGESYFCLPGTLDPREKEAK